MIPRLPPQQSEAPPYVEFVAELRLRGFDGEITLAPGDRTVFATDNSIYQITPQAIAFPRNTTAVVRIARLASEPRFSSIVITPRGGGTGANGQSLTDGIVVDLSRHMNRILEINVEERWARVEAGVVKDQLNDAIRRHGLFFAPVLSPSNRATIGGMIATDASGQGSVPYGKTRDHVLEPECVLLDGTAWHSKPLQASELDETKRRGYALLRIDGVATRGQHDRRIAIAVRDANQDSLHCNGNAACFNYDPDDAMCPSWKATRERRHSPKGRASLMREWLRLMSTAGEDPARHAAAARNGSAWMRWPRRAWNSWFRRAPDFSHEVREAMDGCLACKSCAGQCPIKVDVPAFRSRFLELYYGRYLRPLRHYAVAALESHLAWLARMPGLYNFMVDSAPGRAVLEAIGFVSLPALPRVNFVRLLERRGIKTAHADTLPSLPAAERKRHVVIVPDAFTLHFEPELVADFCELLRLLDHVPVVAPYRPNGKPRHVLGFLGAFERTAAKNAAMLRKLAAHGVALVGLDPSLTLTYRAEYAKALGAGNVPEVLLPQEWLASRLDTLAKLASEGPTSWLLLPHCTERTNAPPATAEWQRVCEHLGVKVRTLPSGCCGMAGLYGHEAANRVRSEQIYHLSWAEHLNDPDKAGRLLATGYSCRSQASLVDGVELAHPISVLLARVKATGQLPIRGTSDAARRPTTE